MFARELRARYSREMKVSCGIFMGSSRSLRVTYARRRAVGTNPNIDTVNTCNSFKLLWQWMNPYY